MATVVRKSAGYSITSGRPFPNEWSIEEARTRYVMECERRQENEVVQLVDDDGNVVEATGPMNQVPLTFTIPGDKEAPPMYAEEIAALEAKIAELEEKRNDESLLDHFSDEPHEYYDMMRRIEENIEIKRRHIRSYEIARERGE